MAVLVSERESGGYQDTANAKAATCTADGLNEKTCTKCLHTIRNVLPATGHDMKVDENNSTPATCEASGVEVRQCANGCGHSVTEEVAQLPHSMKTVEEKTADCANGGYTLSRCEYCGTEEITGETAPAGHKFGDAVWSWSSTNEEATVTLTCENDHSHTKVLTAVVDQQTTSGGCTDGGVITYTAVASFNGSTYEDTRETILAAAGHTPSDKLTGTKAGHGYICQTCGETMDLEAHVWGAENVIKAPTCVDSGTSVTTCTVCGYEDVKILPATGKHDYVNSVCSTCGHVEGSCSHELTRLEVVDLSAYNTCGDTMVIVYTCECGENRSLSGNFECSFDWGYMEVTLDNGISTNADVGVCEDCGLQLIEAWYSEVDPALCQATSYYYAAIHANGAKVADGQVVRSIWMHPEDPATGRYVDVSGDGHIAGYEYDCYCGEQTRFDETSDWNWNWIDGQTNLSVYECNDCDMVKMENWLGGDCAEGYAYQVTYFKGVGNAVYTGIQRYYEPMHNTRPVAYELLGDTCEDGLAVLRECTNCGIRYGSLYHGLHVPVVETVVDLTGESVCLDYLYQYTCPCDAQVTSFAMYDGCEVFDENDRCVECGAYYTWDTEELEDYGNCEKLVADVFSIHDSTGKVVAVGKETWITTHHNFTRKYELLNPDGSCRDGVQITEYCVDCGFENYSWENYGSHYGIANGDVLDLTHLDACIATVEIRECLCGVSIWGQGLDADGNETDCNWNWNDELGMDVCEDCGLQKSHYSQVMEELGNCQSIWRDTLSYGKPGKDPVVYEHEYTDYYHDEKIFRFELPEGFTSCLDGYEVYGICQDCGAEQYWGYYNFHETFTIERTEITDDQMCGIQVYRVHSCACGAESWDSDYWENDDCEFQRDHFDPQTGAWVYICQECGVEKHELTSRMRDPEDPCIVISEESITFYRDGKALSETIVGQFNETCHDYAFEFELLGDDCEDGYTYTATCTRCGTFYESDGVEYNHDVRDVENYYLWEYGLCYGEIYVDRCACGEHRNMGLYSNCLSYMDDENGVEYYHCDECGVTLTIETNPGHTTDPCLYVYNRTIRIEDASGNVVLELERELSHASHSMQVVSAELDDPDGTCENGVTAYYACENCDRSYVEQFAEHDTGMIHNDMDLSGYGICNGSYVETWSCVCGEYSGHDWYFDCNFEYLDEVDETLEDGSRYYHSESVCQDCGLKKDYTRTQTLREGETCIYDGVVQRHFTNDNGLDLLFADPTVAGYHDWQYSTELMPGSETCEDGIYVHATCTICGTSDYWDTDYHRENIVERIDLAAYGSICGAELVKYSCACGEIVRYGVLGECDVYNYSTDMWIPDVLHDSQENIDGYQGVWSEAYLLYCAVTDPEACGLRIRMAEYWLQEGCEAVEYQTWQLGYDDKTGTCMREITVATGERVTFHPYVSTEDYIEDKSVYLDECPECGSYYKFTRYWNAMGIHVKDEYEVLNTLDDGGCKYRYTCDEYADVYNGDYAMVRQYSEYEYADGSESWYEYAYVYDYPNSCQVTEIYTNSHGDYDMSMYENHLENWNYEWISEPTCTQPGVQYEWWECRVCGEITGEYFYEYAPYDHGWSYYWDPDTETEIYHCWKCDLQNVNGASGSIVMEDMTAAMNNGNYVIGYWNRGNVDFYPYVSVILNDVDDDDNELVLTGIDFNFLDWDTDGVEAVTFDQAATQAAADQAIADAGYTGSYAIRISFVPMNDDYTLDYAITFDSQMAE